MENLVLFGAHPEERKLVNNILPYPSPSPHPQQTWWLLDHGHRVVFCLAGSTDQLQARLTKLMQTQPTNILCTFSRLKYHKNTSEIRNYHECNNYTAIVQALPLISLFRIHSLDVLNDFEREKIWNLIFSRRSGSALSKTRWSNKNKNYLRSLSFDKTCF